MGTFCGAKVRRCHVSRGGALGAQAWENLRKGKTQKREHRTGQGKESKS